MRIGNVGIFVKDLAGARKFFEDYFGATLLKTYNEEENNYYSDILQLDEGAWIELMTKPEIVDAPKDLNRTGHLILHPVIILITKRIIIGCIHSLKQFKKAADHTMVFSLIPGNLLRISPGILFQNILRSIRGTIITDHNAKSGLSQLLTILIQQRIHLLPDIFCSIIS